MGTFFWNECKKTLEKDLELEEYSTWIEPLNLKENEGISPKSYSVIAPNNFILNWVEDNYGKIIKERLLAITSNEELNITFEVLNGENHDLKKEKLEEWISKEEESTEKHYHKEGLDKIKDHETNLIPNLTFDAFVEGKSNHIALAAARQISTGKKNSYNPLFIYGGVGLGKPHLMHAAGNSIKQNYPDLRIEYRQFPMLIVRSGFLFD